MNGVLQVEEWLEKSLWVAVLELLTSRAKCPLKSTGLQLRPQECVLDGGKIEVVAYYRDHYN